MSASKVRRQRQRAEEIRAHIREIENGPFAGSRISQDRIRRLEAELAGLRFQENTQ